MNWPGDTRPLFIRALEDRARHKRWRQWCKTGAHADPENRLMVDAVRGMLGLDPLYEASEPRRARKRRLEERERERFAQDAYAWPGGAA